MDTPQSKTSVSSLNNNNNKLINPSSSDSPIVQDSPVFNFISNLSPIQPVKGEPGAQGFAGLASPPMIFTSPRINSFTTLLNRKLQSSGPNLESSLVPDKCQTDDGEPKKSVVAGVEFQCPFMSKEQRPSEMKKLIQGALCSPACVDDFLTDPLQCTNFSCKLQSGDASQSMDSCLEQNTRLSDHDIHLDCPTPLKVVANKSRISIKVVKNEARHLIPSSSEKQGTVSRSSMNQESANCQVGDSLNEASNSERGTLRRCLFDESQQTDSSGPEFWNCKDTGTGTHEFAKALCTGPSDIGQMSNHSKPATVSCGPPVTGNYAVAISKPLGIGLHLNSVVYPRSIDSLESQPSSLARMEGKNSDLLMNNNSDGKVDAFSVGKVPSSSQDGERNKPCSAAAFGEVIFSDVKQIASPAMMTSDAGPGMTAEKRKASLLAVESNKLIQTSPKKKRKKVSITGDDDNPKRCNCKKTKCLKLYCDCFAAGFYCGESCACQGCSNHPDYEATVMETRQQIESRNPLAFAPKVVQPVIDSPARDKEVGNLSTPSSARHKRGCNCKKSMCLKKYCECYQGNVGCSDGCRCEGCQNVFGIREAISITRGFVIRHAPDEMSEALVDGGQECSIVGSNFINSGAHNSPRLTPATPATPALQCSDLRKNALKSRLPFSKCLQTPDSQKGMLLSDKNFPICPRSSPSHSILEKSSRGVDMDQEKCFENTQDILDSACDESESTPVRISNSDASIIQYSPSKAKNLRNKPQPQLLTESSLQPMSSALRWRSSPITPVTQSEGVEFQEFGSVREQSDMFEDETPDILKDSSTTSKSVKVSSPNKKRISAPRNPLNSSASLKSDSPQNPLDSSEPLKVCRKFVLRALPTFPSLTPHSKKSCEDKIFESVDT